MTPGSSPTALGGRPGVRSARYAGEHASDQENLDKLIARGAGRERASLRLRAGIRRSRKRDRARVLRRTAAGRLAADAQGERGFGYDPAFLPDGDFGGRTMAELSDAEKDRISHRGRAVAALLAWLDNGAS